MNDGYKWLLLWACIIVLGLLLIALQDRCAYRRHRKAQARLRHQQWRDQFPRN